MRKNNAIWLISVGECLSIPKFRHFIPQGATEPPQKSEPPPSVPFPLPIPAPVPVPVLPPGPGPVLPTGPFLPPLLPTLLLGSPFTPISRPRPKASSNKCYYDDDEYCNYSSDDHDDTIRDSYVNVDQYAENNDDPDEDLNIGKITWNTREMLPRQPAAKNIMYFFPEISRKRDCKNIKF